MADAPQVDVPTVLGPDCNFKGELTFDKAMRVHGRFEGKITSTGRLHIAKEAKVNASLEAGSIVVEGEVRGALTATERVDFKQSARYEGDLRASKMLVEEGAVLNGQISVGPEVAKGSSSSASSRTSNGPLAAAAAAPAPALTR